MTGDPDKQYPFGDPWFAQIANVHRWLVGDETQPFVLGGEGRDYWLAAFYLCRAVLGWNDVGQGLKHLGDAHGQDGPARVLAKGWGRRLDAMGLWAWIHGQAGTRAPRAARDYGDSVRVERAESLMEAFGFTGGSDPHHLAPHCSEIDREDTDHAPIPDGAIVRQGRRVVLFVDRLDEWHRALRRLVLAGSEPPSWRVDVVARHDGYLGQFRRCWDCQLWFQGRAALHKLGHVAAGTQRGGST